MVRNKLLIIGIVFLILGIIFYLGRIGLATTFLRARLNRFYLPRSHSDFIKVRNIATIAGIFFFVGLTLTVTALLKDRNKKGKQEKKTAYNMNQIMEDELSAVVSRETKKIVAIQEEVISNLLEIDALIIEWLMDRRKDEKRVND